MKVKEILKDGSIWIPNQKYDDVQPVVSVLLPTFRRAKSGYFEKAVQSVLNQTFRKLELIIIDDCSTDGTFDLIEYFMKIDSRVNCIRHSYNIGLPAISEYEGYMRARGDYVAFIFDDNEWDNQYVDRTICFMERENYKAAYGEVHSYDKSGDYVSLGLRDTRRTFLDIYATNFIANGGVILHREVIETVGMYDPHLTLTRLCDWDLWRRVSQKYIFAATGIYAGNEYGAKLKDSLGNTVPINLWISTEEMNKQRNAVLIPAEFENYDVCSIENYDTELFASKLKEFYEFYKGKKWYLDSFPFEVNNLAKKRLLIYTNDFNATLTLSFVRLIDSISRENIVRFVKGNTISFNEFAYVDAVICIRDLEDTFGYQRLCSELKIPIFYYVDDNFVTLKELKNEKDFEMIKKMARLTNYKYLDRFNGIFLSSIELRNFFEKQKLHENIYILEPALNMDFVEEISWANNVTGKITIAFMGGRFRYGVLTETIIPALLRLSKKISVKLLCPKLDEKIMSTEIKNKLNVLEFEYTSSLDLLLQEYKREEPDILIHCGPDIKNNLYKTENSLLNAVQLGAVLVVSDVLPYADSPFVGQNFIVADNTELDWYEKLLQLSQNAELRKQIYEQAKQYCIHRYHPEIIAKTIDDVLGVIEPVSYSTIIQRYESLYFDLFYRQNRFLPTSEFENGKVVRPLYNAELCLSKLVPSTTAYRIKVSVDNWSEIGICFSSYGESFGEGFIYIYDGKDLIREIKFFLEDYVHDFWTYFQFEPIPNSYNKIYTIQFQFQYEKGSSLIGIFEDNTKRSFLYKVFNKLGYRKSKVDVLFTDCRA